MTDIFNQPIEIGTYIYTNFGIIGMVTDIGKTTSSITPISFVTRFNNHSYSETYIHHCINIQDKLFKLKDSDAIIESLNNNNKAIKLRLINLEKTKKDEIKNRFKLQKISKPHDIIRGKNVCDKFYYLGIDSDNNHVYIKFRIYSYNTTVHVFTNPILKLKTKKLPYKIITEDNLPTITELFNKIDSEEYKSYIQTNFGELL